MNIDQLTKIEKNRKFRRHICNKGIWKNYAFVPPSIVLFCGMFGLLYLFNEDMLISLNSIPFVVIFLVGTIWFKSTRKHLIDKRLKSIDSLYICKAISLKDNSKNNEIYFFASNNNRLNTDYLQRQRDKFIEETSIDNIPASLMIASLVKNNDLFITKLKKSSKKQRFLVLLNKNKISLLTEKEITKYKQ